MHVLQRDVKHKNSAFILTLRTNEAINIEMNENYPFPLSVLQE
jgi:hypothetical protein